MPVFKSWAVEDQQIVRGAAKDAATELTRQVSKSATSGDVLKQQGVEVHTPAAAEMVEWKTVVSQSYDQYKASINPGLVTKIEQVVAQSAKA